MPLEIDKYEDMNKYLENCFNRLFGNHNTKEMISMQEVREMIKNASEADEKRGLPENSLLEYPPASDEIKKNSNNNVNTKEKKNTLTMMDVLKQTYSVRDKNGEYYVNGYLGCVDPEDQRDGITNMVLLSLLSNRLAKQFKKREEKSIINLQKEMKNEKRAKEFRETIEYFKKNKNEAYEYKHIALTNIIASIYVLSNTELDYKDYFSYGWRMDDGDTKNKNGEVSNQKKPTFVMDLSGIGQVCFHFKNEEMKKVILENAKNTAKSIFEKKFELGQITEKQLEEHTEKIKTDDILPQYDGKLYEYFSAIPIQYLGEKSEAAWQAIGGKSKDITTEDLEKLIENNIII